MQFVCMQLVHGAGAEYLEAPVSGSKAPAEQGTLIFLTGGDEALFERAGPVLDVMGKAKLFLGQARLPMLPVCSKASIQHPAALLSRVVLQHNA